MAESMQGSVLGFDGLFPVDLRLCRGLVLCSQAIIFANIATYLGSARFRNLRFWHSVTALEDYIRLHKMPRHIAVKVQYYFQFVWQRFQGIDEEAVVAELPDDLRADVLVYRFRPFVRPVRSERSHVPCRAVLAPALPQFGPASVERQRSTAYAMRTCAAMRCDTAKCKAITALRAVGAHADGARW